MAGIGQRGQRVDEARGQPAEPAVAEPGVRLLLEELGQSQPLLPGGGVDQRASSRRLMMLFASDRPIRNSIER